MQKKVAHDFGTTLVHMDFSYNRAKLVTPCAQSNPYVCEHRLDYIR